MQASLLEGVALGTILDFEAASTSDGLRGELKKIAGSPDFSWILEVVSQTADESVAEALHLHPPENRYSPWTVDENFDAAARALNSALDVRAELLNLEASALRTAFDLQLAIQTADLENQIGLVSVSAAATEARENKDHAKSAVSERSALLASARMAQLALHNTSGSAINYGERVGFLRSIYQDSTRVLYQRLYAIRLGLNAYFGVDQTAPPAWTGQYDSLFKLVTWLRAANQLYQERQARESIRTVSISLRDHTSINPYSEDGLKQFFDKLHSREATTFEFDLTNDEILGPGGGVPRLVSIGCTFAFPGYARRFSSTYQSSPDDRARASYAFEQISAVQRSMGLSFSIQLPAQNSTLADIPGADRTWTLEQLSIQGTSPWAEGAPTDGIRLYQERQFLNTDPRGKWRVTATGEAQLPTGSVKLADVADFLQVPADLREFILPVDLVLLLRVAVTGR